MNDIINIDQWKKKFKKFVDERNWREFHNPKNLAMNLSGEAAELMEIFTWCNTDKSKEIHLDPQKLDYIRHEMGDVFMTLIMLADEMDINLSQALAEKVELTEKKYPPSVNAK
jgi:dCTP diphosphatase